MKQTNISIFVPHSGCPHKCTFCDQRQISGTQKPPSPDEVRLTLEEQLPHLRERGMKAEIERAKQRRCPIRYFTEQCDERKEALS